MSLVASRLDSPSGWRVFADEPVHRLAEKIGVPGVAAVLLDQVAEQPTQARMTTVARRHVDELIWAAGFQGCGETHAVKRATAESHKA